MTWTPMDAQPPVLMDPALAVQAGQGPKPGDPPIPLTSKAHRPGTYCTGRQAKDLGQETQALLQPPPWGLTDPALTM